MSRWNQYFWIRVGVLCSAVGTLGAEYRDTDRQNPNVLFIAADDLRTDLSCYGNDEVQTPNLDRLAERALLFHRAYCQQAVCNPSRASLLTGKRLDTLKIWDLPTHFRETTPDAVTLPQHFKNHGYFTQDIGKIFHNYRQNIEGDPISWNVPAVMHYASHHTDDPQVDGELPENLAKDLKCECRDVSDEAYFDGRIASLAIDAIRDLKANLVERGQPFFLAVGFWKPHSPFNAPKRYWDMYERNEVSLAENPSWPINAPRLAWHNSREILGNEQRQLTNDAMREIRHGYLANISYLDAQIGRVLDELDHQGLAEQTIVVFWSDHGYHLGEHTLWAKTSNFELDTRVPLMIAVPGMSSAGQVTNSIAELLDLYPTLVQLCGLPEPGRLEGVSLVPVLNSREAVVRTAALSQHPRPAYYTGAPDSMGYSIRTEQFRYTEWRDWQTGLTLARELYDHVEDRTESKNLAGDKGHQAVVKQHAALLRDMKPIVAPGWTPVLNKQAEQN